MNTQRFQTLMREAVIGALQSPASPLNLPAGGELIWRWFVKLNKSRAQNTAGPQPLAYSEIVSFAQLYRWPLADRHIETLMAMDSAWLGQVRNNKRGGPTATRSSQPMTADIFDAVF